MSNAVKKVSDGVRKVSVLCPGQSRYPRTGPLGKCPSEPIPEQWKVSDGVRKVSYGIRNVSYGVRKVSDGFRKLSGRCEML